MCKRLLLLIGGLAIVTHADEETSVYNGPTNEAGLKLIEEHEGFHANFYKDTIGIRSVGYGHSCIVKPCNAPLNGRYPLPLTRKTAHLLLIEDLVGFESCVRNTITYEDLNANQFAALVSFSYNMGCDTLKKSDLKKFLNQGDVKGASKEFKKWIYAGRLRLPNLVRRREAERQLFCSGGVC